MSKRIANSRSSTKARNGRVRIGWQKQRMIKQLNSIDEESLDEKALAAIEGFKTNAKKVLKSFYPRTHRHQSR
jgi:hypothetical protein